MKKTLLLLLILFALSLVLISCGGDQCVHNYTMATCQGPASCSLCGEIVGEIGDHLWKGATCTSPRTCQICGITSDEPLGHNYSSELCTDDRECLKCREVIPAKSHTWDVNDCEKIRVCTECNFVGAKAAHTWTEKSCYLETVCTTCGKVSDEEPSHDWLVTTCKSPKSCQRCGETTTEGLPHVWVSKGCDKERRCSVCSKNEGFVYGHMWVDATCKEPKHCEICNISEGETLAHTWKEATCTLPKYCVKCKLSEGLQLGHDLVLTDTVEPACEDGKKIYTCNRCNGTTEVKIEAIYSCHVCDANGVCTQCNKKYDTDKMTIESVLLENEYSVSCCGIFTSTETNKTIYKPITSKDVGMPVVDLGGDLPTAKGYTNVVEFTYDSDRGSFVCVAEIKVQGASSAGKPKKNFNIKLYKEDGSKNKVELEDGWGRENKYCMKANYIDYSQSRNVVSAKIFGEIVKSRNDELSSTPNGGAIDGFPILVYNNGEYQGIYTMNIPKDEWMFGMEDSDEKNQAIFMTTTWNQAVSFREISTSGFTLEYASNEDSLVDNSTQWAYDSLLELIEFVYYNDGEDFKNGIHEYADIDKCIDSMIYTFFICADDNTSKNILWVTLDGKVWFSSMYDMDGTWGMRWNGKIEFNENTHPISALVDGVGLAPERRHWHLNLLWERIYVNYYDQVVARYRELRQEILTIENITYHFEAFFAEIPDVVREAEREKWKDVPTQNIDHLEQILTFAEKRIEAMDKILLSTE